MSDHTTEQTTQEIPYGYCHCGCGEKTTIAIRNEYRRGHVKGEPVRFIHGHNPRRGSYVKRFWSYVNVAGPDDCWDWQGCTDPMGYGRFHIGSGSRSFTAHRVAYELTKGPIPDGLIVCHHCDRPPCCNPAHHFLGTRTDNMADKVAKKRHQWGENHPHAKLTDRQVVDIRRRYADDSISMADLAREYGISSASVNDVLRRRTWRHVL